MANTAFLKEEVGKIFIEFRATRTSLTITVPDRNDHSTMATIIHTLCVIAFQVKFPEISKPNWEIWKLWKKRGTQQNGNFQNQNVCMEIKLV